MRLAAFALITALAGRAIAAPTSPDEPPAALLAGKPAGAATLDAVMKLLGVERMAAKFVERKHSALLARPLVTEGTLVYERERGLVRTVTGRRAQVPAMPGRAAPPKGGAQVDAQQVIVTPTTLTIRKGGRTDTVPLAKSKDLQAFALVFPALLRGDRDEIARAFDLAVRGSERDWWALTLTPKAASLRKMITEVVVVGHAREVRELRVVEASGDHSELRLAEIRTNAAVTDAELAVFSGTAPGTAP
jgi:hypothetical protein